MGRRKRPFYRIVAIDSRTRRDGPEIERLGWFDPLKTDVAVDLKEARIIHWIQQGAQPSETVSNILRSTGLKYKMHLMAEGKSAEQIATLLTEWQALQEEKRAYKFAKKAAKKIADAKVKDAEIAAEVASATEEATAGEEVEQTKEKTKKKLEEDSGIEIKEGSS